MGRAVAILRVPTRPNPFSNDGRLHVVGLANRPHVQRPHLPEGCPSTRAYAGVEDLEDLFTRDEFV